MKNQEMTVTMTMQDFEEFKSLEMIASGKRPVLRIYEYDGHRHKHETIFIEESEVIQKMQGEILRLEKIIIDNTQSASLVPVNKSDITLINKIKNFIK